MSILLCISVVMMILTLGLLCLIWLLEYGPVRGWSPLHMIGADATISVGGVAFALYFIAG